MSRLKLSIAVIISFLFIFPTVLSAELSKKNYDVIKIAFLNGYSNAIKGDIDTIIAIKEDREKLKKVSQVAVNSYMEKVDSLNQGKRKPVKSNRTTPVVSNSIIF